MRKRVFAFALGMQIFDLHASKAFAGGIYIDASRLAFVFLRYCLYLMLLSTSNTNIYQSASSCRWDRCFLGFLRKI